MKTIRILLVILSLGFISCERIEQAQPEYAHLEDWQYWSIETDWVLGDQVLFFINEYRLQQGLPNLIKDPNLPSALATQHSNYMISQGFISHDGFSDRAKLLNNNGAVAVGENVAFGYEDAYEVVTAWINSPSHRDTLEGNYTHAGLGIRKDVFGTNYFTLILIRK